MEKKTTSGPIRVRKPHNWDNAVSVAYLRLIGASQKRSAESVGVAERTVRSWEASTWWPKAKQEARDRWLSKSDSACMRAILKQLKDCDAQTARWWADRRIPELLPPNLRGEERDPDDVDEIVLTLIDDGAHNLAELEKRYGSGDHDEDE